MTDADEILAVAHVSPGRRWLGLGALYGLALFLIYLLFSAPPSLPYVVVIIALSGGFLWFAERLRRGTARHLVLTSEVLRDSSGIILVSVANMEAIDRGMFAFKPSNGFLIRSKTKAPSMIYPGLWWRLGRQIGVGGMIAAHQTKPMAEIIQVMLAQRDQV
jgi:hypothetical protein